jgi:hypothetical protein
VRQDNVEGDRDRHGHVSRNFLAFNLTVIFPASDIWCFRRVSSLSLDSSPPASIALSF